MGHGGLVERTAELAVLDEAVQSARAGDGCALVVEGPAGIGKTALLGEARRRAEAEGMAVLAAQGSVLEHDFGFGAVRQLLEPVLARADPAERSELLSGAAALAAPVVSPDAAPDAARIPQPAVLYGLYWLVANLVERVPALVLVDDIQWCDAASLLLLAYLARRLGGLAVSVIMALRSGDPPVGHGVIDQLLAEPTLRVVHPAPLSADGVGQLVAARLGPPDQEFVVACLRSTGGVPFLVDELLRALHADGVPPSASAAGRIAEMGPRTVAQATMLRLFRLPASTASVARAVAVLDRQARLDRVAGLAGTERDEAQAAIERLAGMGLLDPGPPLRFTHPLVRQAVYDDVSVAARAEAHARVAALLTAEQAPADEVAAHLLLSTPEGRPEVVQTLRAAAAQVLARGAPDSAVAYLRRALAEGGVQGGDRAALVYEVASAEAFAWDPRALEDLAEARQLADDPVVRARIGWELAQAHLLSGAWGTAQALLTEVLVELGGLDHDLEERIEGERVASEVYDADHAGEFDARFAQLRSLVDRGGPGTRLLALVLAVMTVYRCGDPAVARGLVEHGLDDGRLLRDEGSESLAVVQGISALVGLDDLDAADRAMAGVFEDAQRRGSVMGYVAGCYFRTLIDGRRGRLDVAETYLRSVFDRCLEHAITFALPSAIWAGTDVLLERTGLDDITDLVESIELDAALQQTIAGAWVLMVRGRLRILHGKRDQGIEDLRAGGAIVDRAGLDNPLAVLWRSPLALALPPEARDEALALVAYELDRGRKMRSARAEGVALRAAAILEGGRKGITLLEQSLSVLAGAGAPLERARTLVELGAAMRRSNDRVAAREPLRAGLELAHVCGAERLVARAVEELHASGARPRREMLSGPDALTSAESRVVGMAAGGMSNKDIAQALFVTVKTVENQLNAAYRKLGVRSRDELRRALSSDLSG